jgi:hypothetical protein
VHASFSLFGAPLHWHIGVGSFHSLRSLLGFKSLIRLRQLFFPAGFFRCPASAGMVIARPRGLVKAGQQATAGAAWALIQEHGCATRRKALAGLLAEKTRR